MARFREVIISVSLLVTCLVETSFAYPGERKLKWTHNTDYNAIVQVLTAVQEKALVNGDQTQHHEKDPHQNPSFYGANFSQKLSDLEAKVEELSTQNGVLMQKLDENEERNRKLDALIAKLEKILGVQDHVSDVGDEGAEEGDNVDGNDGAHVEERIETLSEYLGNREAELVAYNPDIVTYTQTSPVDTLREELSAGSQRTLDLIGRSLVQLSDRTGSMETDINQLRTQITRGCPRHEFHNASANTIGNRIMPARVPNMGAAGATIGMNEDDASRKVAFSAAAIKSQSGTSEAQTVEFQDVMENSGADYLASNHTFVCSVPGWYYFTLSLRTADNKYLGVLLMKNDDYIVSVFTDASDRNTMETQSTVVQLQAGDAVWLRLGPSASYGLYSDDYRYSTFSGFLIFKS